MPWQLAHAFTPSPEEARREVATAPWRDRVPELERRCGDARTFLLIRFPFFGRLALHLRLHFTERVSRMGLRADGNLFINPHYVGGLSSGEHAYLLAHAVLHLAHGHFSRIGPRDPVLWNRATDLALKKILQRSRLPAPKGFGGGPKVGRYQDFMDAEEIYDALVASAWRGQSERTEDAHGDALDSDPGDCDHGATAVLVKGGFDLAGSKVAWGSWARAAALKAKRAGSVGLGEELFIGSSEEQLFPWSTLLHRWVRERSATRPSSLRPARRGVPVQRQIEARSGVRTALPGSVPDLAPVTVALDLSGSISAADAGAMFSETRGILAVYRCPIRVLTFDVEVHEDQDICDVGALRPRGGGGTSFVPLMDRLEADVNSGWRTAGLIVFTDLYGTYPDEAPSFPVLFVDVDGSFGEPPFGDVIRMDRQRRARG